MRRLVLVNALIFAVLAAAAALAYYGYSATTEQPPRDRELALMLDLAEEKVLNIESLIDEKIKIQEFTELSKSQKIGADEIDEEIADLARQNRMTSAQFVQNFEESGASVSTLRDQIESSIAWLCFTDVSFVTMLPLLTDEFTVTNGIFTPSTSPLSE